MTGKFTLSIFAETYLNQLTIRYLISSSTEMTLGGFECEVSMQDTHKWKCWSLV